MKKLRRRLKKSKNRDKEIVKLTKELNKKQEQLEKYKKQKEILGDRNSYSKTDPDATFVMNKEGIVAPCYNVQQTTNSQYIINVSVGQNAGDSVALIDHIEQILEIREALGIEGSVSVTTDAGYGSEENYAYLEQQEINAYVKYAMWHQEKTGEIKNRPYYRENWLYDSQTNTYTCPADRKLVFTHQKEDISDNGYIKHVNVYECESCEGCKLAADCKKSDRNRTVSHSPEGERLKKKARELLSTEEGIVKRSNRGIEVETAFGDIKYNMGCRRFVLRSLKLVKLEYGLLAIGHNLRKVECEKTGVWKKQNAHRRSRKKKKVQKRAS